jgi:sugar phosphate isomerase/epimerase
MSTHPVLAAQLFTVRKFTQTAADLAASLRKVRAIGYTAVQISGIGPILDAEVKSIVDDLGLTICITHTPYPKLWSEIDSVIAQHKLWNCPNVAIGMMPAPYIKEGEAGFHRFAAEANGVGEKLAQAGLTFSYHNHSLEFVKFGNRLGLDILFEETDPRYLKAEIDVYWVQHGGGDPATWVRKVAGRMPVVHLKDMKVVLEETTMGDYKLPWQSVMAAVGEGNLDWTTILNECQKGQVEWYAVEHDVCPGDPFESLRSSYNYLSARGLR